MKCMLFLEMLPTFTVHPMDIKIHLSDTSSCCNANEALSYCRERQNSDILPDATGANSDTLVIENLLPAFSYKYQCVASNEYGENPSSYATLTILGKYLVHRVL